MSQPLRLVIVGGVAAGPKAAARARRLAPDADITIVEKGAVLSYAGCGLPYYISGVVEKRESLMSTALGVTRDTAFFDKAKNIKVLSETEAVEIDRQARELEVRHLPTGEVQRLPYDRLIIATGAETVEPPLLGKELGNVFRLKRVEDADAMREQLAGKDGRRVVIIGGGLIGVEMAEACSARGARITIVELLDQILTMFDPEMAALVQKHLRDRGIEVMTGTRVLKLEGDGEGNVAGVETDRGRLAADLVLLSIGIRPNVALARSAGLLLGHSGGILVNDFLQTSDPVIFAAGDCTEKRHLLQGTGTFLPLGSAANKEGRLAANNALGHAERYPGVVGATAVKVFDWNLARAGLSETQARDRGLPVVTATVGAPDRPHYYPGGKLVLLKLIADRSNRRLLGIQGVGPGDTPRRVDVAITAMTAGMTVDEVANLDLTYSPAFSEAMDALHVGANIVRNKLDGHLRGVTAASLQDSRRAAEDFFLLDVRTPPEHAAGCIPGSVLLPLGALRERAEELPRDKRVVAYCRTSLRAYEAARILAGKGFENVEILDGGIAAWPYEVEVEAG